MRVVLGFLGLLIAANTANAAPITFNFTVEITGPANPVPEFGGVFDGDIVDGSITFDSSVPFPGTDAGGNALYSFNGPPNRVVFNTPIQFVFEKFRIQVRDGAPGITVDEIRFFQNFSQEDQFLFELAENGNDMLDSPFLPLTPPDFSNLLVNTGFIGKVVGQRLVTLQFRLLDMTVAKSDVPTPAALGLLVFGLAGLALVRRAR